MGVVADLAGLAFLMLVAYRGFSVILLAPVAATIPVLLTHPSQVPLIFTSLYMEKAVYFVKLYFPLFLLGAVFGKLIELSGFARSIVSAVIRLVGSERSIVSVVLVCSLLTYGGVSLFVVVFAVYPFAAEMFRRAEIPKRLIPTTLALGAFSFTMDALPGTPQIPNMIPTAFFGTTAWAAPRLGSIGSIFIFAAGVAYLEWQVRRSAGEGYGVAHINESEPYVDKPVAHPLVALLPLLAVGVCNRLFGGMIRRAYGATNTISLPGLDYPPNRRRGCTRCHMVARRRSYCGAPAGAGTGVSPGRRRFCPEHTHGGQRSLACHDEHRLRVRLWCSDLGASWIHGGSGCDQRHPEPAGERRVDDNSPGGNHGLGFRWPQYRLGRHVEPVY